jgi:cell division septal protein FtsQ
MKKLFQILLFVACLVLFLSSVLPRYGRWLEHGGCFRVRKIEVDGNDIVSEKDILKLSKIVKNQNIWDVDPEAAEKRIASNPFVGSVSVFRRHPDAVRILVEEKKPAALLKSDGRFYTLDGQCTLLPAVPGKCYTLPILSRTVGGRLEYGKQIEDKPVREGMAFLLFMLKDRPDLYPQISEIIPTADDGLVLYTSRGGVPVRIGRGGYDWKVRYLEAILAEMDNHPSLINAAYIDLRFEGQVFVGFGA